MSNSLAIAAVTATLRDLLFGHANNDLAGTAVSTRPPDKARNGVIGNQLNLFLYRTSLDAAWRNQDMPGVRPGESSAPPLPLVLHYLVTAYGDNDDDTLAHRLLGRAMSVLHDHPLLGPGHIQAALASNDLYTQVERVRVTPEPLSVDEMSKLWTAFQTQYRISAAYQVCVVLLDSAVPARTPLPVLTRNIVVQAGVVLPLPGFHLEAVVVPGGRPSALLGDELTLSGRNLADTNLVRLSHPRLEAPLGVPPTAAGDVEVKVLLPNQPDQVPAGTWTVAAVHSEPSGPDRVSNELPLAVAPRVTAGLPAVLARDAGGAVTVDLQCSPRVLAEQRVSLLLGDREVPAAPHPAATAALSFPVPSAQAGEYLVRLRVDGVDSLFVDWSATPPVFDTSQKVTIT
jgi:Pvc16 N-terminal domain